MNEFRNSNLHVVITETSSDLNQFDKEKINKTFNELFGSLSKVVSTVEDQSNIELIYEIQTPVFKDEETSKEFYGDLEVLLDELKEFNPHFTQFRRVN